MQFKEIQTFAFVFFAICLAMLFFQQKSLDASQPPGHNIPVLDFPAKNIAK